MWIRSLEYFSVVALWLVDSVMHVKTNNSMRLFSPAKVNLLLAVTGKRDDGFHELISLVTPVSFGDFVTVNRIETQGVIDFTCTDAAVPAGEENLVVKAAKAFLTEVGSDQGLKIHLEKHIPMEAGLGGGSSNAATTLVILNELFESPLSHDELFGLAARLGSDCPLFLYNAPVIMRGRGEEIEPLSEDLVRSLEGQLLAIFRPDLGISTAWAFGKLAAFNQNYADAAKVESQLHGWREGRLPLGDLLFNSFEDPVFEKFVAFPVLLDRVKSELGLKCLMSGSGSSCFALLSDSSEGDRLRTMVEEAFGADAFFEICQIGRGIRSFD